LIGRKTEGVVGKGIGRGRMGKKFKGEIKQKEWSGEKPPSSKRVGMREGL